MKDSFEKYIEAQRDKLDLENPDDTRIWKGIVRRMQKPKSLWKDTFWKAAAIFMLLVSSAYLIYNEFYRSPANIYTVTLSEIEPAYAQQVASYRTTINQKWGQVNQISTGEMKKLTLFLKEMDDLDKMYREYQEDYQNLGYNEELIKAMLDYYDKRVRILDRMLMEIQKDKDYEKRKTHHRQI